MTQSECMETATPLEILQAIYLKAGPDWDFNNTQRKFTKILHVGQTTISNYTQNRTMPRPVRALAWQYLEGE